MKKFVLLLMMCVLASSAWAFDVVFDATVDLGTSDGNAGAFTIEKDCVKIEVAQGLANGIQYRFYKNKPVTISSECGPITRVVFECIAEGANQYGPGCFTVNVGDYSYEDKIGVWTGESDVIVFTASLGQVRATKIIVTVGEDGLCAPVIKPASGTYYDSIEVTITCSTQGAKVYYTTNGSDPTTSSTQYTAPFTLNANTTVKAISELDGEVSDVVTAEYVFETLTVVQNIWESQLLDDGTVVRFANPVNVLAQKNNYLWVKDDTGYALCYGNCGQNYSNGDVIPAGFAGTMTTYSCERELMNLHGFQPASSNTPIEPELITCAQVGHEMFGHYVLLRGVIINSDGSNYWVEDDNGNQASVYFRTMGISPPANLDGVYDIIAIVGSYGHNGDCIYQLLPVSISMPAPPINLCEMINMVEDGTIISVDEEVQVILQSNTYLYFKQHNGCHGLIYGNVGQTYQPGDIIPPGWTAKKTTYNSEPELTSPFSGFQPASRNDVLIPEQGSPLDVNHEHWAHYLVMHDVTVTKMSGNYILITDNQGNSCKAFLRFLQDIPEGHYVAIWGIVGSYRTECELLVTDFDPKPVSPDVSNLSELYNLNQGVNAQFDTPLAVIYQNGEYLYVQDEQGMNGLIFGYNVESFMPGDSIIGVASWTNYQGIIRLTADGLWLSVGHGPVPEPDETPIEEIPRVSHLYVSIKGCAIQDNVIADETGELRNVNRFNVPLPTPEKINFPSQKDWGEPPISIADVNCLIDLILRGTKVIEWDGTYDVTGFTAVCPEQIALYPVKIKCHGDAIDYSAADLNNDGEINIGDLNKLIEMILNLDD